MSDRQNLLNKLGTVEALAATATTTRETIAWMSQSSEFRAQAGTLTDEEADYVESIIEQRMSEYASF